MKLISTSLLLALLFTPILAFAQGSTSIKGNLQDSEGEPAVFSTVSLMTVDSSFVKGTISDEKGAFVLSNINPGSYWILIQNIEFITYKSNSIKVEANKNISLPTIQLERSNVSLDEITVVGKKALVEVHPDKMTFNVASTANAAGNNGLEILSKAPGVLVDLDNNIILQGKSGVKIYINGRPSRLSGNDLVILLQSMQSNNIESIDIITNPSARYEAEGNAGIIDIKLINNETLGYKGSLIGSYSKGTLPRSNLGGTIDYGKNKLNTHLNITRYDQISQDDFVSLQEQNNFEMDMASVQRDTSSGYNISSGITYDFTPNSSLSLNVNALLNETLGGTNSRTEISSDNQENDEVLISTSNRDGESQNYNGSLSYILTPTKSSLISADVSAGKYAMDLYTRQPNIYYNAEEDSVKRKVITHFAPITSIDLLATKLDFEKNFEGIKLEAGTKYSSIRTNNDFSVYNIENGDKNLDTTKSNEFNYKENVIAAYLTTKIKLGQKLNLSVGLRVEKTNSIGNLLSTQEIDNITVDRSYTDYFPNIGLAVNLSENSMLSLGYGKRLTRPNYQSLNPFESKQSELIYFKGNPFLDPNYITNYQLTYAFKNKLIVSNTYSITTAFFSNLVEVKDSTSTIIIPRNMDKEINNGLSVSYPLHFGESVDVYVFGIYNRTKYQGDFESSKIDITANIYNFRVQTGFDLPAGIQMEISGNYNSFYIWRGSILVEPFYSLNFGLKKDFFRDKLQVKISGNDVLNTQSDFHYRGDYGGMKITGVRSFDGSRYGISMSYKFGNDGIKAKRNKSGLDEELNRLTE